jgi:cytochrome c
MPRIVVHRVAIAPLAIAPLAIAIWLAGTAWAGDPAAGQAVFKSQCANCHSPQPGKNMTGPSLFGIVGRKTGSTQGFRYSVGNQNANLTWDEAMLDKYLESPKTVVPGTIMTFAGVKDGTKRADLIAYLDTVK